MASTRTPEQELESLEAAMEQEYGEYIRQSDVDTSNAEYVQLEITVAAETQDEAATIAVVEMMKSLRGNAHFDMEEHVETAVPNGQSESDGYYLYTVYVRQSC